MCKGPDAEETPCVKEVKGIVMELVKTVAAIIFFLNIFPSTRHFSKSLSSPDGNFKSQILVS